MKKKQGHKTESKRQKYDFKNDTQKYFLIHNVVVKIGQQTINMKRRHMRSKTVKLNDKKNHIKTFDFL